MAVVSMVIMTPQLEHDDVGPCSTASDVVECSCQPCYTAAQDGADIQDMMTQMRMTFVSSSLERDLLPSETYRDLQRPSAIKPEP